MKPAQDTANLIIYLCLSAILGLGILSFFVTPVYEKGAWAVITVVSNGLTGALAFKYGVTTTSKPPNE